MKNKSKNSRRLNNGESRDSTPGYSVEVGLLGGVCDNNLDVFAIMKDELLKLPLLRPEGLIIFQVPEGEKGWIKVKQCVDNIGKGNLHVVDVIEDQKGVKRCIVVQKIK